MTFAEVFAPLIDPVRTHTVYLVRFLTNASIRFTFSFASRSSARSASSRAVASAASPRKRATSAWSVSNSCFRLSPSVVVVSLRLLREV